MTTLQPSSDLFSLNDHTILVTGASRGLGLALAKGLVHAGATVVGLSRSRPPEDAEFIHVACDITDYKAFHTIIEDCQRQTGRIDGYLHVAGITVPSPAGMQDIDVFRVTVELNLNAAYNCCRSVGKIMQHQSKGSMVVVTSIGAHQGFPGNPGYVASKGGLRMMSKALAADLGMYNIRVNTLAPGYFNTAMTKISHDDPVLYKERASRTILGRWGQENELVGAAIFLLSDASSYVTGTDLLVDGGWTAKGL
jgi:gluconate 5-dehydrogenase